MGRGYDEMSASEVIADLHGEGYQHPDTGEVWDGETFVAPGTYQFDQGEVVSSKVDATAAAKKKAKKEYLAPFRNAIEREERRLKEAAEALQEARDDLRIAEANAERWYR